MDKINLSDGEWKLMNLLWQNPPKTITQLIKELGRPIGWKRSVIITMLKRLETKDAICCRGEERAKLLYLMMDKEGAVLEKTRGFLNRIFQGSFSLMVNVMVDSRELSDQDTKEPKEILEKVEGERHD